MPAGWVCPCGELTRRPSKLCERCEQERAGRAVDRRRVYDDPRHAQFKLLVWARDGWRCQGCGFEDVGNGQHRLQAHHSPTVPELLARGLNPHDPAYGRTLCIVCHGRGR